MYYNVVIKDSDGYSWNNELIFNFGNDMKKVLEFCEIVLKTSNNVVEILQFVDNESED